VKTTRNKSSSRNTGSKPNEALRYCNNAKNIFKSAPIEDNTYTDIKYAHEARGTAYLSIVKVIDQYLVSRRFGKESSSIGGRAAEI